MFTGDANLAGAVIVVQVPQPRVHRGSRSTSSNDFIQAQVTDTAEYVVQLVGVAGFASVRQALEFELGGLDGSRVEKLAKLGFTQQVAKEVAVESQGVCASLGKGSIAFVHIGRDVVEEQRAGKRRGFLRLHGGNRDSPGPYISKDFYEPGKVEYVTEALAVGLEDDREVAVLRRDGHQACRTLALQPEGCSLARTAPGQEQRPGGILPEVAGEEG